MTSQQQSLGSFKTKEDSSGESQSSQTNTTPVVEGNPLEPLYEDVATHIADIPDTVTEYDCVEPVEPAEAYANTRLPDEIPALPLEIGNWELVARDGGDIYYAVRGPVFDERFGEGGGFFRAFTRLNDLGANKDGKHYIRREEYRGFGHPDWVRNADLSEAGHLSIRGHSPGDNPGDGAVFGPSTIGCGTNSHEDVSEAVTALIAGLHLTPAPISSAITLRPDTAWELSKHGLTSAKWEALAPNRAEKERLRLSLNPERVKLTAFDKSDSVPEWGTSPVPLFDTPQNTVTSTDNKTELSALAAGIPLINELLSRAPEDVWKASSLS